MNRVAILLLLLLSGQVIAHQPVMDMAPRWDEGYGFQTRVEHFNSVTTTWLEGVYTWDKSVRATFKLPYREGAWGDLILGLPLKKYKNEANRTSNWSFTPSVQIPTSSDQNEWDLGLSFSYSAENQRVYQLFDLYIWEDRVGFDMNIGIADRLGQGQGFFWLWDVSALTTDSQGDRIQTGPVAVYFKKNLMVRAEYKALVYERDSQWSGGYFSLGLGLVF
jgi:hypothetical protein